MIEQETRRFFHQTLGGRAALWQFSTPEHFPQRLRRICGSHKSLRQTVQELRDLIHETMTQRAELVAAHFNRRLPKTQIRSLITSDHLAFLPDSDLSNGATIGCFLETEAPPSER